MSDTITVYYDDTPPSSNTNSGVGGRGNPKGIARTKQTWEGIFAVLAMQAKLPRKCARISVKPRLEFRTKARRDVDNFTFAVAKPLGDALVKGGWLADDDYSLFTCEAPTIEVGVDLGPNKRIKGRTVLEITYER